METPDLVKTLPIGLVFLEPISRNGMIRVGNSHDGGYVVPEDAVRAATALLSFGVSTDWSFEEGFKAINPTVEIHAYDHTVGEQKFRQAFWRGIIKLLLRRTSLADVRERLRIWQSYKRFFPMRASHFQEEIHARNKRAGYATIDKVFSRTNSRCVFLKVDIEGSEYSVLDDIRRYSPRIVGLIVEFHETMALRETFCAVVRRLLKDFHIIHIHGNNMNHAAPDGLPNVMEITFAPGTVPTDARYRYSLPIAGLDNPNDPERADIPLRFVELHTQKETC